MPLADNLAALQTLTEERCVLWLLMRCSSSLYLVENLAAECLFLSRPPPSPETCFRRVFAAVL